MNILNKLQGQYDQLWQYVIRPTRNTYPQNALGPQTFTLENIRIKRNSFQLINSRGLVFYCSHWVPLDSDSYPVVIYLHGNSSNQTEGLLTFDFSGCGNSQGQYISLGYWEIGDLQQVYAHVKSKQKITKVGIWGRSMGAVTALRFASAHPQIKAFVYDSPFKNLKQLITDLCKKNSKIPMFIISGALKIVANTIKQKAKFDIYQLDPLKDSIPAIQSPGFFIVASDDQLINCQHTKILYQCYKAKKYLRIVTGGHNGTRPQACVNDVVKFFKKNLKTKSTKQKNTQEVDFFNQDILQGPSTAQLQRADTNGSTQLQMNNDQFQDFINQNVQQKSQSSSSSLFSLNQIFAGMFGSSNNKQKINDFYNQLRIKINNDTVSLMNKNKNKINQKHYKNNDSSFQKMFNLDPQQFIW